MGRWWSLTPWLSFPPRRYEQPKCDHTARAHPIKARDLYKGRQLPGRRRRGGGAGWGRCFRARGPLSGQRPRSGSGSSLVAAPRGPRSAVRGQPGAHRWRPQWGRASGPAHAAGLGEARLRPAPQRTRGVPGSGHAQGAPSAAPVTRREARQALARRLPTSLPSCWARSCHSGFKASSSILVAGEFHSKVCATVQRRRVRPRGYSNTLTAGCARALPRASVVAGLLGRLRPRPPGTAPRGKERPGPCRPHPRRSRRSVLRGGRGLQRPCPPRVASPTASVRPSKLVTSLFPFEPLLSL